MGAFYVDCVVENPRRPDRSVAVEKVLVDTGAEYTWIPQEELGKAGIEMRKKDVAFVMANGKQVTRNVGYAIIRCGEFETIDEVVFGHEGDLKILGARTLEGFPAVVDARRKKLVSAGPLPVA